MGLLCGIVLIVVISNCVDFYTKAKKKNKDSEEPIVDVGICVEPPPKDEIVDITKGTWNMGHGGKTPFSTEDTKLCINKKRDKSDVVYAGEIVPELLSFDFLNSLDMETFSARVLEETGSDHRVIVFSSGDFTEISFYEDMWRITNGAANVLFFLPDPTSSIYGLRGKVCSYIEDVVLYFKEQESLFDLAKFQVATGTEVDIDISFPRLSSAIYSFSRRYKEGMNEAFIHNLTLAPIDKIIAIADSIVAGGEHRYNHSIRMELQTRMNNMQQLLEAHRLHKEGQAVLAEHLEQTKALQLTLANP